MHFSNIFEDDEEYITVECNKFDNNILIYKQKLDENQHYLVKLKENQNAVLFKKGQVFDIVKDEGIYTINLESKSNIEDLKDYKIKENNDDLCVIFFNMDIIKGNKFYIKKKHKNDFYGEGTFDFQVGNPIKLFNKVVQVRTFYSREELLEQIRERITKIVISSITEFENEGFIDREKINFNLNIFDEYGIKITSSDIGDIKFKENLKKSIDIL